MVNYKIYTDAKCYYSTSRNSKKHCILQKAKYCYVTHNNTIISMCYYDEEKNIYVKLNTKQIEKLLEGVENGL